MFDGEQMSAATGSRGALAFVGPPDGASRTRSRFTPSLHETPHRGRTHTPLLGVREPVPGRKAALLVCCHVPDRVSHGLTPLGFRPASSESHPPTLLFK